MNKQQAGKISEAIERIIKAHQDSEPALAGLDISRERGTFGHSDMMMKISIIEPVSEEQQAALVEGITQRELGFGLGKMGTPVHFAGGEPMNATIVKANRSRYVLKGLTGRFAGKQFTAPFQQALLGHK